MLFAALLSISLVGLQTLSQELILLEWMSSFTSPFITVGWEGFLEGDLQFEKKWSVCGQGYIQGALLALACAPVPARHRSSTQ